MEDEDNSNNNEEDEQQQNETGDEPQKQQPPQQSSSVQYVRPLVDRQVNEQQIQALRTGESKWIYFMTRWNFQKL